MPASHPIAFAPWQDVRHTPLRRPVPASDPAWGLVGRVLHARFRLDALLVRGGMGTLLAGHDLVRDQPVVVKIVGGAAAPDGLAADRLLREARLACHVSHPAIVRVLDLGLLETREPFLVMERLDGEDLGAMRARGRVFSRPEVRGVADAIGDALAELHGVGVVHRDVKLENVLVLADARRVPRPRLVDFGLAILDDDTCSRLTRSGLLLGTAESIAPECARGLRASAPSDVYALGVLLYELIAGRPPFEGAPVEILARKTRERAVCAPEIARRWPDAWAPLSAALERDPSARPTAHELAVAFASLA